MAGRIMASREITVEVDMDAARAEAAAKAVQGALGGLKKTVSQVETAISRAFSMEQARKEMDKQLLVMRLNFGKLKAAITDAAAPIGAVVLPAINQAILAAIRFAKNVGLVMGALFGSAAGSRALAESTENAAQAEKKLASAAASAKRSLADFDQIQRLNGSSAGGETGVAVSVEPVVNDTLTPQLQAIVDKILALIAPLRQIDFSPLMDALGTLGTVFGNLAQVIGTAMEWVWFEILAPLVKWIAEKLAPVLVEVLAAGLDAVCAAITPVMDGFMLLWEYLKPIAAFIGEQIITVLALWKEAFGKLAEVFREKGPEIRQIFSNVGQIIAIVWAAVEPILSAMMQTFADTFGGISTIVSQVVGFIIDGLYGVTEFLLGVFTGDWKRAWNGISGFLKGCINGIIGLLNGMIAGIVGALNGVIQAANKLSFTVPKWVPGIGGEIFGFCIKTLSTPQIPYLAQGAVLPANKPFLAMVGDQRHGTNVEAPLATIQEAVALVMQEQTQAILAGFEASVGVQKEILEAVLGIQIGDEMIASAVSRYNRRRAVMEGSGI